MEEVLVIDDDKLLLDNIVDILEVSDFTCRAAISGAEGLVLFKTNKPDLSLVDLTLTDVMDGLDVIKEMRALDRNAKIIVITANDSDKDKVYITKNFQIDDWLTKPFTLEYLVERVKYVCSHEKIGYFDNIFEYKHLKINYQARTVEISGKKVHFTGIQFDILAYLTQKPNIVREHDKIINAVWKNKNFVDKDSLRNEIYMIRKNIEINPEFPELIITIKNYGYRFEKK